MEISELQRRFGVPGVVRIDAGPGGLPRIAVTGDQASAEIFLHGAHVASFQPRGAQPVLFLSAKSHFDSAKPIRGGIPVIFPWFGPKQGSPDAPMHGFARIRPWELESCAVQPDGSVRVALTLAADEGVRLRMITGIGRALSVEMEVQAGAAPFVFEQALHTYLQVGDVRQVTVEGLENAVYVDKVDGFKEKTQPPEPIRITGETDRVFQNTRSAVLVRDPVLGRTITVEKEQSASTVVWNPWIAKARAMADFGDEEWPSMICVETANVGPAAVRLEAGQTHRLRARIQAS